jgi:tetratricopeptide (TPR) repeat protein
MKILLKILIITILAASYIPAAYAQQDLYKKLNNKLATLYKAGRTEDAIEVAKEALQVAEKTFGENHPYVSASLNNLALLYIADRRYEKAEELYERSLQIAEEYLGKDNPQLVSILENMVKCNEKMGKTDKAEMLEARLDKIKE